MKKRLFLAICLFLEHSVFAVIPDPFDLISPENDYKNAPLKPTLQWQVATNAAGGYKIQVSNQPWWSSTDGSCIIDITIPASGPMYYSYTVAISLINSTKYWWRVIAYGTKGVESTKRVCNQGLNGTGQEIAGAYFTTVGAGFVPSTPAIYSQSCSILSLTPTFTWSNVSGATAYDVQISTYPFFAENTIVYNSSINDPAATISNANLQYNTRYNLRVTARSGIGASATYSNWSYSYFNTKLSTDPEISAPSLSSPADGATIPAKYTFTCFSVPNASKYAFQFSQNSSFSPVEWTAYGYSPSPQTSVTLSAGKKYYWRVFAKESYCGPMSVTRSFKTDLSIPDVPVLNTPSGTRASKTLSWNSSTGAVIYQYRIKPGASSSYSSRIMQTNATSVQFVGLAPSTTYNWQVMAGSSQNLWSDWSGAGSFTTEATSPGSWDRNLAAVYAVTYTGVSDQDRGASYNPLYFSYHSDNAEGVQIWDPTVYPGGCSWYISGQPKQPNCGGDCSNFVSQCIKAGGLTLTAGVVTGLDGKPNQVRLDDKDRGIIFAAWDLYWWLWGIYNKDFHSTNYYYSGDGQSLPNNFSLSVGDIIQFGDPDGVQDGRVLHHSTIVTQITNPSSKDGIWITCHNSDRKNIQLSVIYNPDYLPKAYFHRMSHTPNGINDFVQVGKSPRMLTLNDSITYSAQFVDADRSGTVPKKWDWSLVLFHSGGEFLAGQSDSGITAKSPSNCNWSAKVGALPEGYYWKRDVQGQILGKVVVGCLDSDGPGFYHSATVEVAFNDGSQVVNTGDNK